MGPDFDICLLVSTVIFYSGWDHTLETRWLSGGREGVLAAIKHKPNLQKEEQNGEENFFAMVGVVLFSLCGMPDTP